MTDLNNRLYTIEERLVQYRAKAGQDLIANPTGIDSKLAQLLGFASMGDGPPTDGAKDLLKRLTDGHRRAHHGARRGGEEGTGDAQAPDRDPLEIAGQRPGKRLLRAAGTGSTLQPSERAVPMKGRLPMPTRQSSLFAVFLSLAVATPVLAGQAAQPPGDVPNAAGHSDNPSHPLGDRKALRGAALLAKLNGKARGKTHQVARGQYVELAREGEDTIWTVLGEFGTHDHRVTVARPGPLHNQIPAARPHRRQHDHLGARLQPAVLREPAVLRGARRASRCATTTSSSRRTATRSTATSTDWVQVPFNEASYGSNYCGGIVCARTWLFVRDSVDAWYDAQIAAGQDAGRDQRVSAPVRRLGPLRLRRRRQLQRAGRLHRPLPVGPRGRRRGDRRRRAGHRRHLEPPLVRLLQQHRLRPARPATGSAASQIGGSNYWIGDYTVEPENGGVGVFAHEFGHDLGLPDLYDTSGNTGGAENSTGFWTLYRRGSYGSTGSRAEGIGTKPIAHERLREDLPRLVQLRGRWRRARRASRQARPGGRRTRSRRSSWSSLLPDKQVDRQHRRARTPGAFFYYSGARQRPRQPHDRDRSRCRLARCRSTAQVRYDIELDWDYAYLTVNGDAGRRPTCRRRPTRTARTSATASPGRQRGTWVDADGRPVGLRRADGARSASATGPTAQWPRPGFGVDDIAITGQPSTAPRPIPAGPTPGFIRTTGDGDASRSSTPTSPNSASTAATTTRCGPARTTSASWTTRRSELGRALPVSGRPAGLVLRHVVRRQQRRRSTAWPALRRARTCRSTHIPTC